MINLLLSLFQKLNFLIEYLFKKELNEKKLYKEKVTKHKIVVFDIGSNLGNYLNFVSKVFSKKDIELHSFEPIKDLLKHQKVNHGKLIKNNVAITNKSGKIKFYERKISSQSSIFQSSNLNKDNILGTYDVDTINIVDYIDENRISNIDILKIDVEGNELEILNSLKNHLDRLCIKIIKIETSYHGHIDQSFDKILEIYKLLISSNYEYYGMTNTKYKNNKIFFCDSYFVLNN